MRKLRKAMALLLTLAMIMGLSMTTFAAPDSDPTTSNITVNGLAAEDKDTTVNLYAAVTWDKPNSTWVVANWAKNYINTAQNPYTITNAEGLVDAVSGDPTYTTTLSQGNSSVTFENIPVGAYVITASGEKASYAPMVAETYDEDETYMKAEDVTVTAKTDGYDLTKEQIDDNFIARGETVTFKITTTFPSFPDPNSSDNTYKIVDTPEGLDIQGVTSILIGGQDATVQGSYDQSKENYTIDLSSNIGTMNENAGKTVVVTYEAKVTADNGYSNTANAFRNDQNLGTDSEKGYTGDVKITKYEEDGNTVLSGAEFKVYHATKTEATEGNVEALYFVLDKTGVYYLAESTEEGATQNIVATNGSVQVKGLEEGNYWIEETKAPDGYSINNDGVSVQIDANEKENVHIEKFLTDTKLAALPSTGGIGTTIFTIGGCVIMITAAGLYFASRRKHGEN